MDWLFNVDWGRVFLPQTSPLEIVVRGAIMYLALFIFLRVVLKRGSGALNITDLLVVVLLANAVQNSMAADYTSVTDGLILVATIVVCAHALNWLGYRAPLIQRLVHPRPLPLVKDGRLLQEICNRS